MGNQLPDLVSFVRSCLDAGDTPESVKESLKKAGLSDADIEAVFDKPAPTVQAEKKQLPRFKLVPIIVGSVVFLALVAGVVYLFIGSARKANYNATVDLSGLEVPASKVTAENKANLDNSASKVKLDSNAKTNGQDQLSVSGSSLPATFIPVPPETNGLTAVTINDQDQGISFAYVDIITGEYLTLLKGRSDLKVVLLPNFLPCKASETDSVIESSVSINGRDYCVKTENGPIKNANQSVSYTYTAALTDGPQTIKAAEVVFATNGFNCRAAFSDDAGRLAECEAANNSIVINKFADRIFRSIKFVKK